MANETPETSETPPTEQTPLKAQPPNNMPVVAPPGFLLTENPGWLSLNYWRSRRKKR